MSENLGFLKLTNMIKYAELHILQLTQGGTVAYRVPDRKWILIMGGFFGHITGTASYFSVSKTAATHVYWVNYIPSGQASGAFPFWNNIPAAAADVTGSAAYHMFFVPPGHYLNFAGGVGSGVSLSVLEFDL